MKVRSQIKGDQSLYMFYEGRKKKKILKPESIIEN
jgi:hypothetical protein